MTQHLEPFQADTLLHCQIVFSSSRPRGHNTASIAPDLMSEIKAEEKEMVATVIIASFVRKNSSQKPLKLRILYFLELYLIVIPGDQFGGKGEKQEKVAQ